MKASVLFMTLSVCLGFTTITDKTEPKLEIQSSSQAKKLAKAAVKWKWEKAKDIVIDIEDWDYNDYTERYSIEFTFTMDRSFPLSDAPTSKMDDMYLKCDYNGENATFGRTGFFAGFENKISNVLDY